MTLYKLNIIIPISGIPHKNMWFLNEWRIFLFFSTIKALLIWIFLLSFILSVQFVLLIRTSNHNIWCAHTFCMYIPSDWFSLPLGYTFLQGLAYILLDWTTVQQPECLVDFHCWDRQEGFASSPRLYAPSTQHSIFLWECPSKYCRVHRHLDGNTVWQI